MEHASSSGITGVLGELSGGDDASFGVLIEIVYDDLRGVAANRLKRQFGERLDAMTISPTSLTNDVAIELMKQRAEWKNTEHFFAIATRNGSASPRSAAEGIGVKRSQMRTNPRPAPAASLSMMNRIAPLRRCDFFTNFIRGSRRS
mgnify:CR=1 FL=1